MSFLKRWSVAALLAVSALSIYLTPSAQAADYGRQYYSGYRYYPEQGYYYRHFYYKPEADYYGYQHHYCISYPHSPQYTYYYNPYSQQYWGRYDCHAKGYSLLAKADRKPILAQIPEKAFPKPGPLPVIPESKDGLQLLAPPLDNPTAPPPGQPVPQPAVAPGAPPPPPPPSGSPDALPLGAPPPATVGAP
jgi:hypothetical protein